MGKKTKKCSKAKRLLWWSFTGVGFAARVVTAFSLIVIAGKLYPAKQQAKFFNECVKQEKLNGDSISASVHFCNGGS